MNTPMIFKGSGALHRLPEAIGQLNGKKVFVLADTHTFEAAGQAACALLEQHQIPYSKYIFTTEYLEPDEVAVGSAVMHFDSTCDIVVAVGSGVINDISKILANVTKLPYIIVATAPSMDGYASPLSSMCLDGLKVSLPSKWADIIIGDTDILRQAPMYLLQSGLGDMVAKYISICEWRLAQLIVGENYSEEIASMVRQARDLCADNAAALLQRDPVAVEAVFDGLINAGFAMALAGISRPASGVEHYFSHIWDMRGLEYGKAVNTHGLQCAASTYITAQLYHCLKSITPDREAALQSVRQFDYTTWAETLSDFVGQGAKAMIALEAKEGKYDLAKHEPRLDFILSHYDQILQIIDEEIPPMEQLDALYAAAGLPKTAEEAQIEDPQSALAFQCTKDIRDKYVLSRLAWDLGITNTLIKEVFS